MRFSTLIIVTLLVSLCQDVSCGRDPRYRLSRYHTKPIDSQRRDTTSNLQRLVNSRLLRRQRNFSAVEGSSLAGPHKVSGKVPDKVAEQVSVKVSEKSPETVSANRINSRVTEHRNRVPVRNFRPWRSNVKRRPRKPRINRNKQILENIQKEQQREKERVARIKRKRQPQEIEESKDSVLTVRNRSFARKIVEGMLQNVRGGARLISARGNYGYVPLVNKLIDNATLIREDIREGFDCAGRTYGYYADQLNDCQLFHICVPMKQIFPEHFTDKDVYHFSFICPKHTIFSQDAMVCAWQNSAVPCEEAHNLYYMNRNFFVVTNDVKKETATGYPATPSAGGYPGSGGNVGSGNQESSGYPATTGSQVSSGYPASTGNQGSSGYPASTGSQVSSGYPASTGSQGSSGYPASTGNQGTSGYPASTGNQGSSGYPASTGNQGSSGYPASTGNQGTSGYPASTGNQGTSGYPASSGNQGTSVYPASSGNQGSSGYPASSANQASSGYPVSTGSQVSPVKPVSPGSVSGGYQTSASVSSGSSIYPAASSSQTVSAMPGGSYLNKPIITSGPDAISTTIGGGPPTSAVNVVQPGSVYPSPNQRG